MAEKMTTFVWRHSARDQMLMLVLTLCSFPIIWISLELPKRIINDAIDGQDFPRELWSFSLGQTDYLIALCAAYLAAITAGCMAVWTARSSSEFLTPIRWPTTPQLYSTGASMTSIASTTSAYVGCSLAARSFSSSW